MTNKLTEHFRRKTNSGINPYHLKGQVTDFDEWSVRSNISLINLDQNEKKKMDYTYNFSI